VSLIPGIFSSGDVMAGADIRRSGVNAAGVPARP